MTPISCTVMDSFYCSSQPPNAFTSSTHTALVVPGSFSTYQPANTTGHSAL